MNTHSQLERALLRLGDVTCPDGDVFRHLERLAGESRMFAIFAELFPDEFGALGPEALSRIGETRRGIVELARLVDSRSFPLDIDSVEESGADGIPFVSIAGPDPDDGDDLDPGWVPTGMLLGLAIDGCKQALEALGLDGDTVKPLGAAGLHAARLDAELARAPRPLRGLRPVVLAASRQSGLVFFDGACMCGSCTVEWTLEHVRILTDQYAEARRIEEAIGELSNWLDADLSVRAARAIRAWNRAVRRARRNHAETTAA